jgi:hypothetical protein
MEYENDQIANVLINIKNNLVILFFTLGKRTIAAKIKYKQPQA